MKILLLILNVGLIIILKSWYDRNRIADGKKIYHGWEIAVAIAWGLLFTWWMGASWRTVFLQCAVFWIAFDASVNLGRGKPLLYIGSSWIDLLFKKVFGMDAEVIMAICKVMFLGVSIIFLIIRQSPFR